ncbi:leucine-rich repeat-containing protein 15-like [Anopheles ziemanni]|uniref:leucine-rich repeat-containing protein 15-like n=1 Tax=Anopheles coustani TaxID=139045 RepID=UPI0026585F62|nr:leucine-rich repeat-containing protein 15-like [Anopheles coustani]XP_058178783.1 leucine-rich repeat-containing protein 15-like [Anopheles ziemanni]
MRLPKYLPELPFFLLMLVRCCKGNCNFSKGYVCELATIDFGNDGFYKLRAAVNSIKPSQVVRIRRLLVPNLISGPFLLRLALLAKSIIYDVYRDSVFLFPANVDITELTLRNASSLKSFIIGGECRLRLLVIEQSSLDHIPQMVDKVRGLRIIWLTYSLLTELKLDAFLNASELMLVNVAFNQITRLTLSNTRGNSSLVELNLEGNRLEILDMSLFVPFVRLDRLTLTGNRLKQLASTKTTNFPALKALTLERNNITDLSWINQLVLSQLKVLMLTDNAITQLPITWNTLPKLITLGLQGNRLRTLDISWFRSLKSVEQIYLLKNQLETVYSSGPAFRWPSLKLLNLSNNRISKLNLTGCQMSNLFTLVLHDNLLQRIPPGIFQQNPVLSLAIRNNPLKCSSLEQFRVQLVARKLRPAFEQANSGKTCSNTLLRISEINQTICCEA